ncbi:MAG: hypothetical protein ACOC2N_00575 [Spirochaetota bacterium]
MACKITRVQSGPEQGEQWQSAFVEPSRGDGGVRINPDRKYQTMVGFGGAFTEAAAYTLSRMPEERRAEAIAGYFDRERGLGYSFGRIPIHSCDFALGNYTFVNEGDEAARYDVSLSAETAGQPTHVQGTLAPHAIATIVWERSE